MKKNEKVVFYNHFNAEVDKGVEYGGETLTQQNQSYTVRELFENSLAGKMVDPALYRTEFLGIETDDMSEDIDLEQLSRLDIDEQQEILKKYFNRLEDALQNQDKINKEFVDSVEQKRKELSDLEVELFNLNKKKEEWEKEQLKLKDIEKSKKQ